MNIGLHFSKDLNLDTHIKIKNVLSDLYASRDGLLAFTLYSRYDMSPSDTLTFIKTYKSDGFIAVDDDKRLRLTEKGKHEISNLLSNLKKYKTKSENNKSNSFLDSILSEETIQPFEPYLPIERYFGERKIKLENRSGVAPAVNANITPTFGGLGPTSKPQSINVPNGGDPPF